MGYSRHISSVTIYSEKSRLFNCSHTHGFNIELLYFQLSSKVNGVLKGDSGFEPIKFLFKAEGIMCEIQLPFCPLMQWTAEGHQL